ncbi:MAG TPA: N-acetylmuramoyl-L-alanine amidase [Longimicrobiales bacterium]|nr:N-acetylmuramoyl-L-alanine amidase [Longimicrobiales bacterium]
MRLVGALLGLALLVPWGARAQTRPALNVERADGTVSPVTVVLDRGYTAVQLAVLTDLGWSAVERGNELTISVPNEIVVALRVDSPFFTWDGLVLQLADAPYRNEGQAYVPLQLLTDFFPRRLPDLYEFDGARGLLRAGDPVPASGGTDPGPGAGGSQGVAAPTDRPTSLADLPVGPSSYDGPRVVIIDAGHGGADPGALGPRGVREKDIALGIALELASLLRREPNLEVHLTRDSDTFVDLWERGEIATRIKGDRPGLFVSIHGNSFPNNRSARGFETYFLSEARTEHERRVSAIENAPLSFQGQDVDVSAEPDLSFILRELRNLDHQHWSALLADFIQEELGDFHPGPDRGVKQGVLAVLTNALMPSVLVEAGYLSHADEGRLLGESSFQRQAAQGISRAVVRFFERYPPGNASGGSREEE